MRDYAESNPNPEREPFVNREMAGDRWNIFISNIAMATSKPKPATNHRADSFDLAGSVARVS